MPAFTVKNIPEELFSDLKAAAQQHHRSINSEVIVCLEKSLKPTRMSAEERLSTIRAMRSRLSLSEFSAAEITQAIKLGRP